VGATGLDSVRRGLWRKARVCSARHLPPQIFPDFLNLGFFNNCACLHQRFSDFGKLTTDKHRTSGLAVTHQHSVRYFVFASVLKYDVGVVPSAFLNIEMNALGVL
jgi:hypothetical protein